MTNKTNRYSHVSVYIDEVNFGWRTHCYDENDKLIGVFSSLDKDTAEDISLRWDDGKFEFIEQK